MNKRRGRGGAVRGTAGRIALVALLGCGAMPSARAQQPVPARPDSAARRDTALQGRDTVPQRPDAPTARGTETQRGDSVRPVPPITPGGAFLRSLAIPGWGQARLGRNVTGGLFLLFEGIAGAMVWKAQWQLEWAHTRGKFIASHRQEREDWLVLLAFNHLLAATEAYVSAHLYDFPAALNVRSLPGGGTGVGLVVPLH